MILFSVTTLIALRCEPDDRRLVAVCTSLEHAQGIVERNEFDIHEMEYRYCVIEELDSDIAYGIGESGLGRQWWYEWNGPNGWDQLPEHRYVTIPQPPEVSQICGWWG